MGFEKIKVYAFVGPSGTGKSYRAQMVASENDINFIIDDGLLIKDNEIVAGLSAKKAPTKIETVKHALFLNKEEHLGLPQISKTTYINEVATEEEMKTPRHIRETQGKHVIPVPTFELKKDFSGYLLDPLQIFKSKGIGEKPYISEKTIIRPTFSYMGKFTISDTVFRQIMENVARKIPEIYKVQRTRVTSSAEGPSIYMEVTIIYGCKVKDVLREFKERAKKEIDKLTSMNVVSLEVVAKNVYVPEKENGEN